MRNIRTLFFIVASLLVLVPALAEESVMTLGGRGGWSHLGTLDGVVVDKGRYGYDSVQLATNSRLVDGDTDLLIDFDGGEPVDASGHYDVESNSLIATPAAKMGTGAALSRGGGGLQLSGRHGSLFGSSGGTGSFLIEFWLCPSIAENGEEVFSWRSSRTQGNYPLYQMISASFYANRLSWKFTNVFNGYTDNGGEVTLSCYRTIIPDVWMHHAISFDEGTGLLEYRIDGKLEGVKYVTSNGLEDGAVYVPVLGVVADIDLCPRFTGKIDDFRIQRTATHEAAENLRYDAYKKDGGRFETEPLRVSRGATLTRLDAVLSEPSQTAVVLYVRAGDNYFAWNDEEPRWVPVQNHAAISGVTGLYFQVAADLFPDGGGAHSPSITQIDVRYTEVPPPMPPFTVIAEPGDGQVTLTWSYSVDGTAGGYLVYYGERPGEYLGYEAVQGESPLDAGNVAKVTLTGLKNGKIYYFAVASYSKLDGQIVGTLSKEAFARPLKR